MKSILITGVDRGLGLGMVKYLIKSKKAETIFATCLSFSEELKSLTRENKNLHIYQLDVKHSSKFEELVSKISKVVGNEGLNVVIHNAGIITDRVPIDSITEENLVETLKINTIGPIMLTKALLPLLRQASNANSDKPAGVQRAIIVNITSKVGSIALNEMGGSFAYRVSKTALNAATKTMSIDLKNDQIIVISMHPGWVKTAMGGKDALIDIDLSVTSMIGKVEKLTAEDTGKFFEYNGKDIPW